MDLACTQTVPDLLTKPVFRALAAQIRILSLRSFHVHRAVAAVQLFPQLQELQLIGGSVLASSDTRLRWESIRGVKELSIKASVIHFHGWVFIERFSSTLEDLSLDFTEFATPDRS